MPNPTYQYSNGFDLAKVNTALVGRVGWQQPTLSSAPDVSSLTSKSGRYYNDGSFHTLVSPSNLKAVQEDPLISDDDFVTYLQSLQKSALARALNGVFNEVEFIEQTVLFERWSRNDMVIANSGLFVGYEIDVANRQDASVQIENAILYFDSAVTFNLYLFRDGNIDPIWQQSVTTIANSHAIVPLTDLIINYGINKGGKYYFGYYQNDIGSAKAYQEQVSQWNCPIMFRYQPMIAPITTGLDFNINNRQYPILPYGLNLEISSFKDYTQEIIRKPALFDELQGLCMAYMVLEQIVYAVRSNGTERILKEDIARFMSQLDLSGIAAISDSPHVTGLKQRIEREINRVKKEFYRKPKAQSINLLWS